MAAVTIVSEIGAMSRFENARQLMGYSGLVPSEFSSGKTIRRGRITKTGNAHLRRVIVESAWSYRYRPWIGGELRRRQRQVPDDIKEIAWKAQHRLYSRYKKLTAGGKNKPHVVTAIGRELLGFIWAIGIKTETRQRTNAAAA
jgi:transposase